MGRDETRAPLKMPAWEASGRQVLSKTLPLHPSRNSILMTIPVTTQIWVILLIGSSSDFFQPIRSTMQSLVVTRHQYGISVLVPQVSFREETSGGITKCQLFS